MPIWVCDATILGKKCGCCISTGGDQPPDHPCARGHRNWREAVNETECECWMGQPLPGQKLRSKEAAEAAKAVKEPILKARKAAKEPKRRRRASSSKRSV